MNARDENLEEIFARWQERTTSASELKDGEFQVLWHSWRRFTTQGENMLWTIIIILLVLWALGWGLGWAGGLIHLLLVVALIVLIVNMIRGRTV